MSGAGTDAAAFTGLTNLAAERLGAKALSASDEFFAEKENLLKPGRGIFIPDKYTENGKWMDGWESRRKRVPGHDWCVIRLGTPGIIHGVDIDTNHFLGNHPPYASIEACDTPPETFDPATAQWVELLPKSALKAGSQNIFAVGDRRQWTHVRLNIYPDGGVARFRVYGEVKPDWASLKPDAVIDLACLTSGSKALACSDMFFSPMENLILPGPSTHMGDGWETRRKRGPGNDWIIVQLGAPGMLKQVEVDTSHFKGNYPDRCSLDACYLPGADINTLNAHEIPWRNLLPESKLQMDHRHFFEKELSDVGPVSHVRLNIYPDGGVARLRCFGVRIDPSSTLSMERSHDHAG